MTDRIDPPVAPFAHKGGSFTMQPDGTFKGPPAEDEATSAAVETGEPETVAPTNSKTSKGAA